MVTFGNHASVRVPRAARERIRGFYRDVLGCIFTEQGEDKDVVRIGDAFYVAFLYGDFADESEFLRTGKSMWLELKCDDVDGMKKRLLDFGVAQLDIPDDHLYFQSPGGQVFRLVGIDEDLSTYEGNGVVASSSPEFWRGFDRRS